jgi:hypothetical protein
MIYIILGVKKKMQWQSILVAGALFEHPKN